MTRTKKRRKNETACSRLSISLTKRFPLSSLKISKAGPWWEVAALTLLVSFHIPPAIGELSNNSTPELLPPALTILERPKTSYRIGDVITYRVQVRWTQTDPDLRMRPPAVDLFNLKLIGITEETASGANGSGASDQNQHVLSFNFRALEPGPARIEPISLKWTRSHDAIGSQLTVPGFDLTIRRTIPLVWFLLAVIGTAIGGTSLLLMKHVLHKPSTQVPPSPTRSFAELELDELRVRYAEWKKGGNHQEFLDAVTRIVERYLTQELGWHFGRDSYNEFKIKAEAKWVRKDAVVMWDTLKKLEYQRYSGISSDEKELEQMYKDIFSFITRKRVISSE